MLPKLIITDIDGVWTDGSMYYDQMGNELKRFNTADSAGVLFAKHNKIPVVIITGENTEIVTRRAKKLNIDYLFQGVSDKVKVLSELIKELNMKYADCAYIGDDINDYLILKKVGYSAAPSNAPEYIKSIVSYVTKKKGGEGAFRDFVEHLLRKEALLESTLNDIIYKNEKPT